MAHNHSGEFLGEDCCCHLRVQVLRLWGAYVGSGVISVAETSCVGDVVLVAETSCVRDVVRRRRRRTLSTQKCCVDSAPSRSSVTARRHGDRDGAPSRSIVRRAVTFERACACTHARQCRCHASSAAQMRLGMPVKKLTLPDISHGQKDILRNLWGCFVIGALTFVSRHLRLVSYEGLFHS